MKQNIISRVTNGKISPESTRAVVAFIQANEGRMVEIGLKSYKRKRSDKQNAHYWGCVVPTVYAKLIEIGEIVSPEDVHLYLKGSIGGFQKRVMGKWVTQSSTELSTAEWSEWLDKICAWGALNGIAIPMPERIENE